MSKRKAVVRYALVHLAELVAVIGGLVVIWFLTGMAVWLLVVLVLVWVLKDALLFTRVWRAYATTCTSVLEELVGQHAIAASGLKPRGFVRVRGELWKAELQDHRGYVREGETARVVGVRGMTLLVEHTGSVGAEVNQCGAELPRSSSHAR